MKIKDFKEQLKSEQHDIPDILDNIRDIAYKKEFKRPLRKNNNFKLSFSFCATFCLLILAFILIPKPNTYNVGDAPESISPFEEQIPAEECPETPSSSKASSYKDKEDALFSAYDHDGSISSDLLDGITSQDSCVEEECLLQYQTNEDETYYILNEEMFEYLKTYLTNNPNATIDDVYYEFETKFNITKDKLYAVNHAYAYITNEKGNE